MSEDYLNFLWVDRVSQEEIGNGWVLDDVQGSALFRLYRARISEHWMLIRGGDPERGSGVDRSERVSLESSRLRRSGIGITHRQSPWIVQLESEYPGDCRRTIDFRVSGTYS